MTKVSAKAAQSRMATCDRRKSPGLEEVTCTWGTRVVLSSAAAEAGELPLLGHWSVNESTPRNLRGLIPVSSSQSFPVGG